MIEIYWSGPYSWPKFENENKLQSIPNQSGAYLQAVEYLDGYLIYAAGFTRRPIPIRFREHTRNYMKGEYNVLDIDAMKQGIRNLVWQGWGWTEEKRTEFEKRKSLIQDAVYKQLAGFRIFITDIGMQPRILERLEAAIMNNLYQQQSPFCDVPDKGMMIAPRWETEEPITIKNNCKVLLYGLPQSFEI